MDTEQLIIAVGATLLVTRLFGWMFRGIGQPQVVGEMMAGIALSPSFLGRSFPGVFELIIPPATVPALTTLSQLGLILFMFVVGLELDLKHVLKRRATVVLTSNVSILLPLVLGVGLAAVLYEEFAPEGVGYPVFALFMGTAMSVTAFPVLARILKERNLLGTELGAVAISCAAIDDTSAWLLLALLTAMVHADHNWLRLAATLCWLGVFVVVMFVVVRRAAARLETYFEKQGTGQGFFSLSILIMLASCWVTERLGVHALFGALVAGMVMSKNKPLVAGVIEKMESFTLTLLLPIFFVLTGMRTRIDLLAERRMWAYAALIIGVAIVGKLAGAAFTARMTGLNWRGSFALGVLLNTRGLVELVVLNVGLELGILSQTMFSIMVIMALFTTFMTTPLLSVVSAPPLRRKKVSAHRPDGGSGEEAGLSCDGAVGGIGKRRVADDAEPRPMATA